MRVTTLYVSVGGREYKLGGYGTPEAVTIHKDRRFRQGARKLATANGIKRSTVEDRIKRGATLVEALTRPVKAQPKRGQKSAKGGFKSAWSQFLGVRI